MYRVEYFGFKIVITKIYVKFIHQLIMKFYLISFLIKLVQLGNVQY